MPLYLIEFGYTSEAWAGLVKSPENREEIVGRILEDAGGTLHSLWYSFGESDGFAVFEAPDNITAGSFAVAVTASGAFRKFETHALLTQDEMLEALAKAGEVAYTAPGAAVHA